MTDTGPYGKLVLIPPPVLPVPRPKPPTPDKPARGDTMPEHDTGPYVKWEERAAAAYERAAECVRDGDHDSALENASAASEALRVALGERAVGDLDDWFENNLEAADA